jgi:hypothetical protein
MSVAAQTPTTAASGAYQAPPPAPLDFDKAQALYALWKNVFASSRDDGDGRDDTQSAPSEAAPSSDSAGVGRSPSGAHRKIASATDGRSTAAQHDLEERGSLPATNPQSSGIREIVMRGGSNGSPLAGSMTEVEESSAGMQPEIPGGSAASALPGTVSAGVAPTVGYGAALDSDAEIASARPRALEEMLSSVATEQSAADSVNVFVHGSAVAIVVRDPAVSDHEAVQCAFETARKLTGQRTGLVQLTLNGRILYQQQVQSPTTGALPSAALVFAC